MPLPRPRLAVFALKVIVGVVLFSAVWPFLADSYSRVLMALAGGLVPWSTEMRLEAGDIVFYASVGRGTNIAWIPGSALHYGLIVLASLMVATPGLRLRPRLGYTGLALAATFALHLVTVVAMAWLNQASPPGQLDLRRNPIVNLLLNIGTDLFPLLIWAGLTLKYWAPLLLGRAPATGLGATKAPGVRARERPRSSKQA